MKPEQFTCLSTLLKKRSGLILTEDKGYLVESRLNPVAQKHGLPNLDALITALQRGNEVLAAAVTEAMTTNETSFFRDTKPFDMFRKDVLPEITGAQGRHAHIAHLVGRRLDGAGSLFPGHAAARRGCEAGRLEDRDRRHRHFRSGAETGAQRHLQPFRSAAWLAGSDAGEVFRKDRWLLADRGSHQIHGVSFAPSIFSKICPRSDHSMSSSAAMC